MTTCVGVVLAKFLLPFHVESVVSSDGQKKEECQDTYSLRQFFPGPYFDIREYLVLVLRRLYWRVGESQYLLFQYQNIPPSGGVMLSLTHIPMDGWKRPKWISQCHVDSCHQKLTGRDTERKR